MTAYTSKLNGWGMDRAIAMKQAGVDGLDNLDKIKAAATELAKYAYSHEEDLISAGQALYQLLRDAPDGEAHFEEVEMSIAAIKAERAKEGLDQPKVEISNSEGSESLQ